MSDSARQRSQLVGMKLRALVKQHVGSGDVAEPSEFAPGAALVHGDQAWVYLDAQPADRLGAALAWSLRSNAEQLNIVADEGTGQLARRARHLGPAPLVWRTAGRDLISADPDPLPATPPLPETHEALRPLIIEGGAEPVVEHGVLVGEVYGLEICRVVDDEATGEPRLEVGTGAHDREAFQLMHGDIPTVESLRRIVDSVAEHRRPGASQHPLNRLGAERLLRSRLLDDPSAVGAIALAPVEPPVPRANLKDPVPCVAHGTGSDGELVVVVCSSGVDLELVPVAADAYGAAAAGAAATRLVLATPKRDRLPLTVALAERLLAPTSFATVDAG